ncbi:MAG: restriction endonuclease subunit S, partial [Thermaurantiacus sp.]
MNAERLLALYERVADAPDAIARLKRFVLDLAVRGRLVPQDPNDEPASELLKRIAAEKARLVKAGEFREPRSAVLIKRDELPFTPPPCWGWAKLTEIAQPSYGFAFPSSHFNGDRRGMPLIRIRDISRTETEAHFDGPYDMAYLVRAGDYLVGMDGDFNLRRWNGPDGLLNQRVMRINGWRCGIDPEFVRLPLQMVLDHLHGDTSLTTVKHLSAKQVNGIEIPLPPLAGQRRIVAKVEELMAVLDGLEAARQAREATRDRFTA